MTLSLAPPQKATTTRLAWPDVARGISILAVIVLHMTAIVPGGNDTWLASINEKLQPIRLHVFFFVSGFLGYKVIQQSFSYVLRGRIAKLLIPYLVWGSAAFWLLAIPSMITQSADPASIGAWWTTLLSTKNYTWFLAMLAIFTIVLWASRTLQPWVVIALSFVPLFFLPAQGDNIIWHRVSIYLPVFMIGAYSRQLTYAISRNYNRPVVWAPAALAMAIAFIIRHHITEWQLSLVPDHYVSWPLFPEATSGHVSMLSGAILPIFMLPALIIISIVIAKVPVLSQAFTLPGRHTLVLYIGHPLAMALFFSIPRVLLEPVMPGLFQLTWLWLIILFLGSALVAWTLHRLSHTKALGWSISPSLITPPRRA